jgi:hypothetical protein
MVVEIALIDDQQFQELASLCESKSPHQLLTKVNMSVRSLLGQLGKERIQCFGSFSVQQSV